MCWLAPTRCEVNGGCQVEMNICQNVSERIRQILVGRVSCAIVTRVSWVVVTRVSWVVVARVSWVVVTRVSWVVVTRVSWVVVARKGCLMVCWVRNELKRCVMAGEVVWRRLGLGKSPLLCVQHLSAWLSWIFCCGGLWCFRIV